MLQISSSLNETNLIIKRRMEENLILFTYKWKLVAIIVTIAIISVGIIPLSINSKPAYLTPPILTNGTIQQNPDNTNITTDNSNYVSNNPSQTILLPTSKPTSITEPTVPITNNIVSTTNKFNDDINIVEPIPQAPIFLNESETIQSAINALGPSGGEITLQSDAIILTKDVQITSNIIFSGVDPNITLHLESKRLNVAKNAENVTIRNLIMDATNLGDRNALVIYAGAKNVSIENVTIENDLAINNALLTQGNHVQMQNLIFINVTNSHPIQIASSDSYVKNCYSNDQSVYALVTVAGGISNVHIEENVAENRPLFDGGYTAAPSSDIWIQNNKLINFPKQTYGILVMGGTAEIKAPFDRVFVLGNNITAGVGAYNGIAIYGLSSNIIVANNRVNQTLSKHNAIGVASGINVTVTQNIAFGCTEGAEGGIEVESNPVHNRFTGISENVNVTNNIVFGSQWGIYVRTMVPDHVNWDGNPLKSKNILIEGNTISNCTIGINLLYGDGIIVKDNNIINNTQPLQVSLSNVLNYTISCNLGYSRLALGFKIFIPNSTIQFVHSEQMHDLIGTVFSNYYKKCEKSHLCIIFKKYTEICVTFFGCGAYSHPLEQIDSCFFAILSQVKTLKAR